MGIHRSSVAIRSQPLDQIAASLSLLAMTVKERAFPVSLIMLQFHQQRSPLGIHRPVLR
jgi:hypothetical protein